MTRVGGYERLRSTWGDLGLAGIILDGVVGRMIEYLG